MLRLYNTLTRRVEPFRPREAGVARMYTCGPTVYRSVHIGNLRSYLMADWLRRLLQAQGYQVLHVKNITDVGHMRQEMLERGEDKVIAAALAEGKTPQEIAHLYTQAFHRDEERLNILPAHRYPRASDHIPEMIDLTRRLQGRGLAYEREGNVYFEVAKFPEYGKLSGNLGTELLQGVRVETDPLKRDPRDFSLWRAAEPGRTLKWDSPWGEGFPGWHIECSTMSIKYLGRQLDIHTGGVDNIFPHHEGEIAQSEGAFNLPFVRHWLHGQHLLADGVKMAKSAGNSYTLADLEARGLDPIAFRYLCLTTRYRHRLNFTLSALKAAQRALLRLQERVWVWRDSPPVKGHEAVKEEWRRRFMETLENDLDLPGALSLAWDVVRSGLPPRVKLDLLLEYDGIFGLGLDQVPQRFQVPQEALDLLQHRAGLRRGRRFTEADALRSQFALQGYVVRDTRESADARPKTAFERRSETWPTLSISREAPSLLDKPDATELSVNLAACNYREDVRRCVSSVLAHAGNRDLELLVVDNGSEDGTETWLEEQKRQDPRLRVIHTDHVLGEAAAKNIGLRQSRGRYIVQLDPSTEVTGDLFTPLAQALENPSIGVAGPFGLYTQDLRQFHDAGPGDVDAVQAYCFAFRRALLGEVGLMPESFRFYRNLDLEFSFRFKERGYRAVALANMPLRLHEHRVWTALSGEERDKLSRQNFRRFLRRWDRREDLLVANQAWV